MTPDRPPNRPPARPEGPDRARGLGGLHGWRHPAVLSAAAISAYAGFAAYATTAALPDVAAAFGEVTGGDDVAARAGLSLTTIGIGLGVIRAAALGDVLLAGLADGVGRRRTILATSALGLALTVVAAGAPSFALFVVVGALARPLLSTSRDIATVIAAEETRARDRAWALTLITAGYGMGAGIGPLLRGAVEGLGFRALFLCAVVPLVTLPLLARVVEEPSRYRTREVVAPLAGMRHLRGASREVRRRLAVVGGLLFAFAFLSGGPVNTFLFLYAESELGMDTGLIAIAVLAAAPVGTVGLLAGRAAADRFGRVSTAAVTHALAALTGVWTYTGSTTAVVGGYLATILVASTYAPAAGAIGTELFPTALRATAAGVTAAAGVLGTVLGLLAFGTLTQALDSYGAAAAVMAVPVLLSTVAFRLLPETRGMELEESAPD